MTPAGLTDLPEVASGARAAAFFDFDGTLIDGYSAAAFLRDRARRGDLPAGEAVKLIRGSFEARAGRIEFDDFMRSGVHSFRGHDEAGLARLGDKLLRGTLGGLLFPEMLELLEAHRRRGHTLAIASSALPFQVQPVARDLAIDHVLCTQLETVGGLYTGRIAGPVLWGSGKAKAVRAFAGREGIDLTQSYAYGNGDEDVEFLETVGNPRAVNPGPQLRAAAEREGWPIVTCAGRSRPRLVAVARSVAAYGGMAASFGAGLGFGLLTGSRRNAVNFTMAVGSDVALELAGVRLNVTGADNLSVRPAVFTFNHQSLLDGIILMNLMREDVTGVAKKELESQPGFGHFARLMNMAFVDRTDAAQAKAAIAPVVEKLRSGYSILIAPEGTRSATPAVGRFKKGAFHIAMQGAVPIVPIVIRNAGEILWRGSKVMRSGTVDVHVHDPIDVASWRREELDARVEEVRQLYVRTLGDWPTRRRLSAAGQSREPQSGVWPM
jgi:HAD superfamily hydrolase (TIGR01490 family)